MEVINYHRPVLGTFHAKLCVIDRKVGLLQSNNIQDNDNLEMMVHLEGPIVDAMYDTLLISWHKHLDPALPMLGRPAAKEPIPAHDNLASKAELTNATASGSQQKQVEILPESTSSEPHYDQTFVEEAKRVNSQLDPRSKETRRDAATRHLSKFAHRIDPVKKLTRNLDKRTLAHNQQELAEKSLPRPDGPDITEEDKMTPYIVLPKHEPVPMALVNREPNGCKY